MEAVSIPVIANGGSSNNRNSEANTYEGNENPILLTGLAIDQ